MSRRFLSTIRMPRRAVAPTGGSDGDLALVGDLLYSNNSGTWSVLNVQYTNVTTPGRLHLWTSSGTTDASGTVTFTIPAGAYAAVHNAIPVVLRNTTAAGSFAFAFVRTQSTTSVVVQVAESKNTGVLLGGVIEGLEASGAGITVNITVYGV